VPKLILPKQQGLNFFLPHKRNPKANLKRKSSERLKLKNTKASRVTLNIIALLFGLALWQLGHNAGLALPAPSEVVVRFFKLIESGIIINDVAASLRRVLIGFALGTTVAIPIGFLMGWYWVARGLIEPYVQFFRTVPPLAIIPLAIVLLGIGEEPKILVIFLGAFFASVIATFQGVVNVDKTLINAATVLGAKDASIFFRVVVPSSAPFILVGMRLGLGSSWATLVAAELIAAQEGIGFRMQQAQLYYQLDTIFVGLLLIGFLGLAMDRILLRVELRLTSWQERRNTQ
jgi:NitT/TauT family transport system permease protein